MPYDSEKSSGKGLTFEQLKMKKVFICPKCKCTIIMKDGKTYYEEKPDVSKQSVKFG